MAQYEIRVKSGKRGFTPIAVAEGDRARDACLAALLRNPEWAFLHNEPSYQDPLKFYVWVSYRKAGSKHWNSSTYLRDGRRVYSSLQGRRPWIDLPEHYESGLLSGSSVIDVRPWE